MITVREFVNLCQCDFHTWQVRRSGEVVCKSDGFEEVLFTCGDEEVKGWEVDSPEGYVDEMMLTIRI